MSQNYTNPFPVNSNDPLCSDVTCTPCVSNPNLSNCFICGYPHGAFENCRSSATPCLDGSVTCLDCESAFSDIKFLGGYVSGFSTKLGFGPSESTLNIDLTVLKHGCSVQPSGCVTPTPCPDDVYTGQIGYIYTFKMGNFCFKGILTNHNYTEDNSGYKYRVNMSDGRSILGGCSVLLNGFYDPVPDALQPNLINIIRELEPSIYNDQCGLLTKCNDFMKSGSNQKGILLKKAIEALDGKCITVPISGAGLVLNTKKLAPHINEEIRTQNQESTALELIDLACQESGLSFFIKINNDNEIEVFPINYKININNTDLFNFVENLNNSDIVISKDYGQEMTFEKGNRVLYGAEYCYITRVRDMMKNSCSNIDLTPRSNLDCQIKYAPWQQPNVRSPHFIGGPSNPIQQQDYPIEAPPPNGC